MHTREGLIVALAEAQRKHEYSDCQDIYVALQSRTVVDPRSHRVGRPDPGELLRVQTALREHWRGQPPASQRVARAVSLPAL